MNAAEDRLSELMDAATCALDPPIDDILAAGERLGRARKRRRHIAVAAGTAVVVLLAGAGVAVGVGDPDFGGDYDAAGNVTGPRQATPIPDTRAPSELESPNATPTTADLFGFDTVPPKPGEVPISATAAVNILRKLVAANWRFGAYKPSSTRSLLQVDVDDGKGLSEISVAIAPVGTSYMSPVDCAKQGFSGPATPSPNPAGLSPTSDPAAAKGAVAAGKSGCYVAGYDNGDQVMLEVLTSPQSNVVIDRVIANRSDGIAIEIMAWNGDPTSAYDQVTRAWPPLDVERWADIAVSRMWQPYVSASLAK